MIQDAVEVAVRGEAADEGLEVCEGIAREGIALEADLLPTAEQRILLQ